jgi:peptide/nickel transport system substrate-binding protein
MKLFALRWFVVSSIVLGAMAANAAVRPEYGGMLRITMRAAPTSLDPADSAQADSFGRRSLTMLIFDTLLTTDTSGRIQPWLAVSWQASADNRRWQLKIRRGVKFHDGTPLTAEIAAVSLRTANPSWNVSAEADTVVIESDKSDPELPAELAIARNAIGKRNSEKTPNGTGPFHVVDWAPGKKLTLAAEENCWRGRPFLDAIEIEMGQSFRDQMTALELGKADLVEVAVEQTRQFSQNRISERGTKEQFSLTSSSPMELVALLFSRDAASPEEKLLRETLALSIERGSIRNVLLQGAGQPTASILPNWMTGYGFVFAIEADLTQARHAREQAHTPPVWTVGYDGNDPMARLLAERVALNARDAGLLLQPTFAASTDLRLVRIPIASRDPWIALADVAALFGVPAGEEGGSVEDLYAREAGMLATRRVIPMFHLPVSYAASARLKGWTVRPDGRWTLAGAWLTTTNKH